MAPLQERLARLRRFNMSIRERDPKLAEESLDRSNEEIFERVETPEAAETAVAEESIILRTTRPVLAIRDNDIRMDTLDRADSEIWQARLTGAKPLLDRAIRAVGRIDLQGARLDWVGTGWLVAENILVTNRHVAREFVTRKAGGFTFQAGLNGPIGAGVDFLQEIENPARLVFKLIKPLHVEEEPGPDVAFFEVEVAVRRREAGAADRTCGEGCRD